MYRGGGTGSVKILSSRLSSSDGSGRRLLFKQVDRFFLLPILRGSLPGNCETLLLRPFGAQLLIADTVRQRASVYMLQPPVHCCG